MLFLNLLKAFGLDIPARVAELKARVEQRVEDAAVGAASGARARSLPS